jgi:integrase
MYQNFLVRNGLSSSAIKFKRSAISSLNNYVSLYYAEEYKDFRQYITKAIQSPPPAFVHAKEPLTIQEYNDLCAELEKRELWQQLAYLRFSFASGARRAEVRQLLKEVVDYEPKIIKTDNGDVKIYTTNPIRCKGRGVTGKVRKLNFGEEAMQAIKKWLSVRGDDECPHVFAVIRDGKYSQVKETTFNSWTTIYFEKIVGRRIHPHAIREARATTMVVENKKDIKAAQKLLGHQSSTTTEIYVIRQDQDDADDAFI